MFGAALLKDETGCYGRRGNGGMQEIKIETEKRSSECAERALDGHDVRTE